MTVTEIIEVSRARSKVYIDQEFAFVLYKGELRLYHIAVGEELSEADYRSVMTEVLPKRARLRCMNLLKSRDYTEEQLRQKLRQGDYPEEVIREAVRYVASFRYIDDLRYAVNYITGHEDSKSRRRLEQDLLAKGIAKETVERAFAEWQEQGGAQDEGSMMKSLLRKKGYDPETADYKERQRIYGFLMRKGFAAEEIRKAMKADIDWD